MTPELEEYLTYLKGKSLSELRDIRNNIDKDSYPDKFRFLTEQIDYLNANSDEIAQSEFEVVGFWLRLLTDIVDAIILGVFGFILSIPLRGFFSTLGEDGLWIGLAITFLYTGILQSKVGKGQSLAKKMFNIEVIGYDGKYLDLSRAFLRYVVIALIFYNGWIGTAITSLAPFLNNAFFTSLYAGLIAMLFFGVLALVPLHPLKRGIHDIIAGSIVIRKGTYDREKYEDLNSTKQVKIAFIVSIVLAIFAIGLMASFYLFPKNESLGKVMDLYEAIENESGLSNVQVNHHTFNGPSGTQTSINIEGFLKKRKLEDETVKEQTKLKIVKLVQQNYTRIDECNSINVTIRTGFNIGIASSYYRENTPYNIDGTERH